MRLMGKFVVNILKNTCEAANFLEKFPKTLIKKNYFTENF